MKAYWQSITVNHFGGVSSRVVRESTTGPYSSDKCHRLSLIHTSTGIKKELTVDRGPAAGGMDEPSEQMRPLLRTVSPRPAQLTASPPLYLYGSLSVFAPCLPSSRGSDAWESDSVRHHPAAAIVSRLSTSDTWHGYKLSPGLFFKSTKSFIQICIS